MKVGIFTNEGKPRAVEARRRLAGTMARFGLEEADDGAEVVICLGGDGTILRAAHRYPGIALLGFNLGGLGYLAGFGERDFDEALGMLAAGRYAIAERTMLETVGRTALNDIVVMRELTGYAAELEMTADGRKAARYLADGVIVATPTGSTAYSLSAGGPVLMPDSESIVVTPMNPHALGIRPMVMSDKTKLVIRAVGRQSRESERLGVYADGEAIFSVRPGEEIAIAKSERTARFVEIEGHDPYGTMAAKLGWSQGNVD